MSYPRIDIKEVDKSQPTDQTFFSGTPAAVIGTANSGPAFVPTLLNSEAMFVDTFGDVDSKHWGSVAVRQWYSEAKENAGLIYTRVLGVGNGKKRSTNNVVTNAGYAVGEQQVQTQEAYEAAKAYNAHGSVSVGSKGANPFANEVFQKTTGVTGVSATKEDAIIFTQAPVDDETLTITIPAGYGDDASTTVEIVFQNTSGMSGTPTADQIFVHQGAGTAAAIANLTNAINGVSDNSTVKYGSGIAGGVSNGISSLTASAGTTAARITLTADLKLVEGNSITLATDVTGASVNTPLAGGVTGVTEVISSAAPGRTYFVSTVMSDSAGSTYLKDAGLSATVQPVLRAVVLVASGVELTLSGWHQHDTGEKALTGSAYAWGKTSTGALNAGSPVGAMKNPLSTQEVKFIFNGMKENTGENKRVITVGFNPANPGYLGGLNTDPDMFEQKGHYLYAHYPVPTEFATPSTASGSIHQFTQKKVTVDSSNVASPIGDAETYYHNVLLTTGSADRNSYSGTGYAPNYEGWNDRFSTPFTPWVISQAVGGSEKKLFRIHSLDDGEGAADQYFAEVYDIEYPSNSDEYSSFSIRMRKYGKKESAGIVATDKTQAIPSENSVIAGWQKVNLDPNSDRYIAKIIGDYHSYYNFDGDEDEQKLVVSGLYPNTNKYFRVQVTDDVANSRIQKDLVPFGFQGMHHLVTSGSTQLKALPQNIYGNGYGASDDSAWTYNHDKLYSVKGMVTPPVPLRVQNRNSRGDIIYPWGVRFDKPAAGTLYTTKDTSSATTGVISLTGNGTAGSQFVKNSNNLWGTNYDLIRQLNKFYPSYAGSKNAWVGDNAGVANDASGAVLDSDEFLKNKFTLGRVYIATKTVNSVAVPDNERWHNARYIRNGVDPSTSGFRFLTAADLKAENGAQKYTSFVLPMQGGFDGLNIFNKNHRSMNHWAAHYEQVNSATQGGLNGATVASYRKAIDILSEKTDVDINVLAVPGQRSTYVTDHASSKMEERFDAIYLMDIEICDQQGSGNSNIYFGDKPLDEQNVDTFFTIERFAGRGVDSSFAAAYYPLVNLRFSTADGGVGYTNAPASIAALGVFALTDRREGAWGTPAGYDNGRPKSIENVNPQIVADDVKDCYLNRINPVLVYNDSISPQLLSPEDVEVQGTGIISGQKTLLKANSALNRLDVRRLMVYVRRQTRDLAYKYIFEPNKPSVLASFSKDVSAMLESLRAAGAVDMFKVVIDETTTSQTDIENNTVRGKVFVKPYRSAEIISIDINIQNQID